MATLVAEDTPSVLLFVRLAMPALKPAIEKSLETLASVMLIVSPARPAMSLLAVKLLMPGVALLKFKMLFEALGT
jgi:hypothetical protein